MEQQKHEIVQQHEQHGSLQALLKIQDAPPKEITGGVTGGTTRAYPQAIYRWTGSIPVNVRCRARHARTDRQYAILRLARFTEPLPDNYQHACTHGVTPPSGHLGYMYYSLLCMDLPQNMTDYTDVYLFDFQKQFSNPPGGRYGCQQTYSWFTCTTDSHKYLSPQKTGK